MRSDMSLEQADILQRRAAGSKARGGFDIVGARRRHDLAKLDLFLLGQVTGFNNHLENMIPDGLLDGFNLLQNGLEAAVFGVGNIDDHIDFISAVCERGAGFLHLRGGDAVAEREPNHCADIHSSAIGVMDTLDITGRHADRRRMILGRFIAKLLNILPGRKGF